MAAGTSTLTTPVGVGRARVAPPVPGAGRPKLRPDIQGLRAVAVGSVLLYHADLPWVPGGFVGVDVFFVISGFLITQGLVRELAENGRISLSGFYARRVRRILPAATVTLLGVVALTVLLLPRTRWLQLGQDVIASAAYFINWDLADRSVDYLARTQAPSPLQHFWSLAVEEQFYLLWPLLIVLVVGGFALVSRVRGSVPGSSRQHLAIALALIVVPSLLVSIVLTASDPGRAYFVSTTRGWELGLGAALAILGPGAVAGRRVAGRRAVVVVGALGLAAIAIAAWRFTSATPFPGAAALLPTLGAAAVIWAGAQDDTTPSARLLSRRSLVWIGGLSYSLYLWHWPLIVIVTAEVGRLPVAAKLAVVALSVIPAWLSLKLVERPALRWPWLKASTRRSLLLGAICTLLGVTAGWLLHDVAARATREAAAQTMAVPGARVLTGDPALGAPVDSFPAIVPSPLVAANDGPDLESAGCGDPETATGTAPCILGVADGAVTIALVGDSHAGQLVPGLEAAALANGWRLDVYWRNSCPFTAATVELDGRANTGCDQRNRNTTAALLDDPPTLLVVATSRYRVWADGDVPGLEDSKPAMARGFRQAWAPFVDAGVPIVTVRDTPRPNVSVPECVVQNQDRLTRCAMDRDAILWADSPEVAAARGQPSVHVLDLTEWICPTEECPMVIGGALVFRDDSHLTATYSRSLSGVLGARLADVLADGR